MGVELRESFRGRLSLCRAQWIAREAHRDDGAAAFGGGEGHLASVLLDDPQRTMRGMLRGAATGSAPRRGNTRSQERSLAAQALDGAVTSAMSSVPEALARAVEATR